VKISGDRGLILLPAVCMVGACSGASQEDSGSRAEHVDLAFTINVEVDTPEGVRKGQSINQAEWTEVPGPRWCSWTCGGHKKDVHVSSEAAAIDLPHGRTLFVLLSAPDGHHLLAQIPALRSELAQTLADDVVDPRLKGKEFVKKDLDGDGKYDLPRYVRLPYFITFANTRSLATAAIVDPFDLSATFGKGYRLRRMTIRPGPRGLVPTTIEGRLPWLKAMKDPAPDEDVTILPFPRNLYRGSFIKREGGIGESG
jgi:hypothetical protein